MTSEPAAAADEPPAKPKRTRRKKVAEAEAPAEAPAPQAANDRGEGAVAVDEAETGEGGEPRRGWWQRTFGA